MIDGMGSDSDQRIAGEQRDLLPAHAQILAEGGDIDLITQRQIADDEAQLGFALPRAQPPVKLLVERALFGNAAAIEAAILTVDPHPDALPLADHGSALAPPQFVEPVRKAFR